MPRGPASLGRIAGSLLVLVVVISALALLLPSAPPGLNGSPVQGLTSGRDPYQWPFAANSVWNLPIGAGATYVAAHIKQATSAGMTTDPDVIILTPTAPSTAVYQNNDGWSGGSRCSPQGGVLFNGPIPTDFVVPGATSSSTPNYATAILMPDNHTLAQGQPMARCTAGGPATMMWYNENEDLYGLGFSGGHGGSMLSSIGGTLRLGELVPGAVIRHALKVNLYAHDDYYYDGSTKGYRWPATTADSYASSVYGGSIPALRMGSLLALPASLSISSMGLETQPARILAQAFQDYGAYTVDDTGWSVYAIETEFSPSGKVEDQFQSAWGFSMTPSSKSTPWARDMDRIFANLSVVDDWNQAEWNTVSASNGTQGAGGGAPLVAWAPPIGSPAPPLTADFTFTPTNPQVGQSVGFTATASGGTSPYSFAWTFGDGATGSGATVSHGYAQSGSYTVTLTATDAATSSVHVSHVVTVSLPPALTADFTFTPTNPDVGQSVAFTATASGGTPSYSFAWTFGDGATGSGTSVGHAYAQAGNFTVVLTVRDAGSQTTTATRVVSVTAPPPPVNQVTVQSPASGAQVTPGQPVTVSWTSSGSLQADSAALSYSADGGATWNPPFATGQPLNGSLVWNAPSVTTNQGVIRVVAKDAGGNNVEGRSGEFIIGPIPPGGFPTARLSYSPAWPQPTTTVTFDASASAPSSPNDTLEARWDWQTDGIWDTPWSASLVVQHTYGAGGTVVVHLEVMESSGAADNATVSLVLDGTPPVTTANVAGKLGTGGWYVSNVTVSLSATDRGSGVASTFFRVDGSASRPYSAPFSLGNGRHEVDFYSVDRAGVAEAAQALRVRVDSTHPTFRFASPTGVVSTSEVQVSWNATDTVSSQIEYATSVDGGPFVDRGANTSVSLILPDGDHSVVVRATAASGNQAETTITFRVDTNPFSFTGPYHGGPTIGLIAAALLLIGLAGAWRRRKTRRARNRSAANIRSASRASRSSAKEDVTPGSRTRNS